MKRILLLVCVMLIGVSAVSVSAKEAAPYDEQGYSAAEEASSASLADAIKCLAAALAVGISCIAGGIAVGRIGSASMGAISENPDLFGKAMPFVGLAEGICLWGFLVALLILFI